MVRTWGGGPSVSPQLAARLHEQLQFYKDMAQKLEAEVQHLKEELALHYGSSPRPPASRQLPIQKSPSPITSSISTGQRQEVACML